jgi:Phytanoyl-CoA dioxygenase (PhyH)
VWEDAARRRDAGLGGLAPENTARDVDLRAPVASLQLSLAARGYLVLRDAVPREACERALRHIHLDLVRNGLPAETLGEWLWGVHWFPHLKWDPPILELASYLPAELTRGEMCDPQILLQPPDKAEPQPLVSHVDQTPEWANGRPYIAIAGVALSPAHATNGGLVVWPFDSDEPEPTELDVGDVVVMHPQLPHASGYNREGAIRYAVYFRFLEPA